MAFALLAGLPGARTRPHPSIESEIFLESIAEDVPVAELVTPQAEKDFNDMDWYL